MDDVHWNNAPVWWVLVVVYAVGRNRMNGLKECPFCGSENVELRKGVMFNGAIHCTNCTADVIFDAVRMIYEGDYDWQSAITEKWNMRTGETE